MRLLQRCEEDNYHWPWLLFMDSDNRYHGFWFDRESETLEHQAGPQISPCDCSACEQIPRGVVQIATEGLEIKPPIRGLLPDWEAEGLDQKELVEALLDRMAADPLTVLLEGVL